jgi:hypothetical protein
LLTLWTDKATVPTFGGDAGSYDSAKLRREFKLEGFASPRALIGI